MFTGWRKPINTETDEEIWRNTQIRIRLINELSIAVKELQKSHMDSDFEVDRNDEQALLVCTLLEAVFLHGYQGHGSKFSNFYNLLGKISTESVPSHSFWEFLTSFTHKDIVNELQHLTHINTDVGRSRAWIRLALNDGLIESYLDAILSDHTKLQQYYKSSSFLMDNELPFIMMSFLQGLVEYKFDFNYNTTSLNTWTGDALALSGIWQLPKLARLASLTASGIHSSAGPSTSPVAILSHPKRGPSSPEAANAQLAVSLASEPEVAEIARSIEDSCEYRPAGVRDTRYCPVEIKAVTVSQPLVMRKPEQEENFNTDEVSPMSVQTESGQSSRLTSQRTESTRTTTSPTPMIGSNKLGMTCGWSSAFEPESHNIVVDEERHQVTETPSPTTDIPPVSAPKTSVQKAPSFTTLLSNYTVQGPNRFDAPVYDESDNITTQSTPPQQIPQAQSPSTPLSDVAPSGFEIVPHGRSIHSEHTDERTQCLMANVTEISNEKGLDSQNYQCRGCGRNIGMIYGEAKVCIYDACYYCYECHVDDEHVIPARVIHNWDFRKHRVARHTKLFLLQIEEEPLFNVDETNPTLYNVIKELHEVKILRSQLQHLKGFLFTCKQPIAEEIRRRIWPREYLWDDIHQYSLLDLVQVQSGQLAHHLKKIISHCTKHVYRCKLCCQKGFICEICHNPKIIYPFEVMTTSQCEKCRSVYHKPCILDKKCPKCIRKRKQHATKLNVKSNFEFDAPW